MIIASRSLWSFAFGSLRRGGSIILKPRIHVLPRDSNRGSIAANRPMATKSLLSMIHQRCLIFQLAFTHFPIIFTLPSFKDAYPETFGTHWRLGLRRFPRFNIALNHSKGVIEPLRPRPASATKAAEAVLARSLETRRRRQWPRNIRRPRDARYCQRDTIKMIITGLSILSSRHFAGALSRPESALGLPGPYGPLQNVKSPLRFGFHGPGSDRPLKADSHLIASRPGNGQAARRGRIFRAKEAMAERYRPKFTRGWRPGRLSRPRNDRERADFRG